jgi:hypothetical protein
MHGRRWRHILSLKYQLPLSVKGRLKRKKKKKKDITAYNGMHPVESLQAVAACRHLDAWSQKCK